MKTRRQHSMPKRYCPNQHGDDPTGEYIDFYASTETRRACEVYSCAVCGELFALTYDGMFYPVPDETTEET